MVWPRQLWLRLQTLLRPNRSAQRLNDEIQFHLEQQTAENIPTGMSPEEARYAAMRAFGNPTFLKEETRDSWGWTRLEHLAQDLRYGLRTLRKNLGFTAVAVLTVALGIGANTAIFQLIDALRLRSIPVKEPQQLVIVQLADSTGVRGSQASGYPVLTNPVWEKLRDQQDVFSGVLAWGSNSFGLTPGGDVRLAQGLFVSGSMERRHLARRRHGLVAERHGTAETGLDARKSKRAVGSDFTRNLSSHASIQLSRRKREGLSQIQARGRSRGQWSFLAANSILRVVVT